MHERVLLRRVAAGWLFAHRSLLEHFAALSPLPKEYAWDIADRGIAHYKAGNERLALAALDKAIQLGAVNAKVLAYRGWSHFILGNETAALADFDQAVMLHGQSILATIKHVATIGQTHQLALRGRAWAYLATGNYTAAQIDFGRVIGLGTQFDWHYYGRSLTYLAQGKLRQAKRDLQRAMQIATQRYSQNPDIWRNTFNLALYRLTAGEIAEAERLYREAATMPAKFIQEAVHDLEVALIILPNREPALAMQNHLLSLLADE